MERLSLLEYHEDTGSFHDNAIINGVPHDMPETYGWASVAYTFEPKESYFCHLIYAENRQRRDEGKKPLKIQEVRFRWKMYSYVYNMIATNPISEEYADLARSEFNSTEAIAKIGVPNFADEEEYKQWEYNPLSFNESNF